MKVPDQLTNEIKIQLGVHGTTVLNVYMKWERSRRSLSGSYLNFLSATLYIDSTYTDSTVCSIKDFLLWQIVMSNNRWMHYTNLCAENHGWTLENHWHQLHNETSAARKSNHAFFASGAT